MSSSRDGRQVGLISESASLLEVLLGDASVKRGPAANYNPGPVELVIDSTATYTRHSHPPDVGGLVVCKDDYTVRMKNQDKELVSEIKASFIAAFSVDLDEDPGVDPLNDFAQSTGRLVIRPYAREFMQQMSIRMGLPALTLEVLRFKGVVLDDSDSDLVEEDELST